MKTYRTVATALATFFVVQATSLVAQTDVALKDELLALRESDQSGRMLIQEATREHGPDSPELTALWEEQSKKDTKNLARLREMVAEHGWPGESMVGHDAAVAAFLIVQHADHETQVEFFPLMEAAAEAGELQRRHLAMLQDRILVDEGKPQIFGTQLYLNDSTGKLELFPIEDETNVDSRRLEVGMMPLAEYVRLVRGEN